MYSEDACATRKPLRAVAMEPEYVEFAWYPFPFIALQFGLSNTRIVCAMVQPCAEMACDALVGVVVLRSFERCQSTRTQEIKLAYINRSKIGPFSCMNLSWIACLSPHECFQGWLCGCSRLGESHSVQSIEHICREQCGCNPRE